MHLRFNRRETLKQDQTCAKAKPNCVKPDASSPIASSRNRTSIQNGFESGKEIYRKAAGGERPEE